MDERERQHCRKLIPVTSETLLKDIGEDAKSARWKEFVKNYGPMMEAHLASHFPGVDAEDVIQETYAALVKVLPDYVYDPEGKGAFHCYLTALLSNKARDALRKKQSREQWDNRYAWRQVDLGEVSVGAEEDGGEDGKAVPVLAVPGDAPGTSRREWENAVMCMALGQLRRERKEDQQWQMFWRTWLGGESPEAVAESLGVSVDSVYQARKRLKVRLAEIVKILKETV